MDDYKPQKVTAFTSVCKRCGKTFMSSPEWAYRRNGRSYCSWSCYHKSVYPDGVVNANEKLLGHKPSPKRKVVLMYTPDGKYVRKFGSITEASDFLRITSKSAVSLAASGLHNICGGYKFRFESDGYKEGEDL